MVSHRALLAVLVVCALTGRVYGGDWITEPSYYTHDQSGARVQQYTPIGPFYIYPTPGFQRSGYHHTRSSIQVGSSVDHFHQVEEWGRPVRPYDEWRFPYRPYSAPYELWGPPYAGLGYGFGRGYYGAPGFGYGGLPGGGFPGYLPGIPPLNGFGNGPLQPTVPYRGYQPWSDDRYPAFDDRAPFRQRPFP
jgi:hypothetical protein